MSAATSTIERESALGRPVAAAIAIVVREDRVLLVRRANAPDAGRWGFPGGKIEFGETVETCAVRELLEETHVTGRAVSILTAVDAFDRGSDDELRQHFVLIAVLCRWVDGEPIAADDALDARWFGFEALQDATLALSLDVETVARLARHALDGAAR